MDWRAELADALGTDVAAVTDLDGGHVGRVRRVDLADGRTVVAKTGDTPLTVEARMLRYLARETALPVPAVHHASDDLLVLEHVPSDGAFSPAAERDVAEHLAALHGVTADRCGFGFDTLDGPYRLPNPWTDSWVDFFREHRLLHTARAAREEGAVPDALFERLRAVAADCDALLAEPDAPTLRHGDVWRGNVLVRDGRVRAFLDPAISYGHPETDLAYVDAFDAFGDPFFERYADLRGIDDGFDERKHVYALQPLLVHVRVFGDEYLPRVRARLAELGY